ncbi:unnamed protein product [Penicillium pancosmium]
MASTTDIDAIKSEVNNFEHAPSNGELETAGSTYETVVVGRTMRKVDWRLLPVLTVLYLLAFIDRGNIGNAKVAGMNTDLELTSKQYNIALTVFFFPYSIFEVPSNIVLKIMRPSLWICIIVFSWGVVMTCQGLVKNYDHLIVTRVLLGVSEAGFFPAANYLLTTWYCRFELQTRIAIFFSAASLAGAFSGLLAFAIEKMDGVGGYAGWRWIFILEGAATVLIASTLPWTLPDSPNTASFLNAREKEIIITRLEQDTGTSSGIVTNTEKFQWKHSKLSGFFPYTKSYSDVITSVKEGLLEWKIYVATIVFWGSAIPVYAFTYSAPSIILGLGYSSANAQLLTVPVYLVGVVSTVFFARLSDRSATRWKFIIIPFLIATCGFIALLAIPHPRFPGLTYAMLFCIPAGCYPPLVGVMAWSANNLAPSWKRAVGVAVLTSVGNLGGAIGSNIFMESQKPSYHIGYAISLTIVVLSIISTLGLRTAWKRLNDQRNLISEEEVRQQYTEDELLDLGDKSPLYR